MNKVMIDRMRIILRTFGGALSAAAR